MSDDPKELLIEKAVSAFRETDPVGFLDQPRFLNAAVAVDTELGPRALLELVAALHIEPLPARKRVASLIRLEATGVER